MSSFYYGVHKGRDTGVFRDWKQVQPLVTGFTDARFKKFTTESEALEFVRTGNVGAGDTEKTVVDTPVPYPQLYYDYTTTIHVYTDGAYSSRTKRCGVGVSFDRPYAHYSISKRLPDGCTHQQAELDAIVCALWVLKKHFTDVATKRVVVWTDSDYSHKCILKYIHGWRRNGWVTSKGDPVMYQSLIAEADKLLRAMPHVELRHISDVGLSSHATQDSVARAPVLTRRVWQGNKDADELARGL